MALSVGIDIEADHLAVIIDIGNPGARGARHIDRREVAVGLTHEAMADAVGVNIIANDPAQVVDAGGAGVHGTGDIDHRDDTRVPQKTPGRERVVSVGERAVVTDDLPPIVDLVRC